MQSYFVIATIVTIVAIIIFVVSKSGILEHFRRSADTVTIQLPPEAGIPSVLSRLNAEIESVVGGRPVAQGGTVYLSAGEWETFDREIQSALGPVQYDDHFTVSFDYGGSFPVKPFPADAPEGFISGLHYFPSFSGNATISGVITDGSPRSGTVASDEQTESLTIDGGVLPGVGSVLSESEEESDYRVSEPDYYDYEPGCNCDYCLDARSALARERTDDAEPDQSTGGGSGNPGPGIVQQGAEPGPGFPGSQQGTETGTYLSERTAFAGGVESETFEWPISLDVVGGSCGQVTEGSEEFSDVLAPGNESAGTQTEDGTGDDTPGSKPPIERNTPSGRGY